MPVDKLSQDTQDREPRLSLCFHHAATCISLPLLLSPYLPPSEWLLLPTAAKSSPFSDPTALPSNGGTRTKKPPKPSRATKRKGTGFPKLHFQLLLLKGTSRAPLNRPVSKPWEQRRGFTKQLEAVTKGATSLFSSAQLRTFPLSSLCL